MVTWPQAVSAIGAVVVPVVVIVFGFLLNTRLKAVEARQWRSQELVKARIVAYRELVGPLSDLLCYFTFVGGWKLISPPDVIALKRATDRSFHCNAPLFGGQVSEEYSKFMKLLFSTYNNWGEDAKLDTVFERRRDAFVGDWSSAWNQMFVYSEGTVIPESTLKLIQNAYNKCLSAMVADMELTGPRFDYAVGQSPPMLDNS